MAFADPLTGRQWQRLQAAPLWAAPQLPQGPPQRAVSVHEYLEGNQVPTAHGPQGPQDLDQQAPQPLHGYDENGLQIVGPDHRGPLQEHQTGPFGKVGNMALMSAEEALLWLGTHEAPPAGSHATVDPYGEETPHGEEWHEPRRVQPEPAEVPQGVQLGWGQPDLDVADPQDGHVPQGEPVRQGAGVLGGIVPPPPPAGQPGPHGPQTPWGAVVGLDRLVDLQPLPGPEDHPWHDLGAAGAWYVHEDLVNFCERAADVFPYLMVSYEDRLGHHEFVRAFFGPSRPPWLQSNSEDLLVWRGFIEQELLIEAPVLTRFGNLITTSPGGHRWGLSEATRILWHMMKTSVSGGGFRNPSGYMASNVDLSLQALTNWQQYWGWQAPQKGQFCWTRTQTLQALQDYQKGKGNKGKGDKGKGDGGGQHGKGYGPGGPPTPMLLRGFGK